MDQVVPGVSDIQNYPSKHWLDNLGFEVISFSIADPGSVDMKFRLRLLLVAAAVQVQQQKHLLVQAAK